MKRRTVFYFWGGYLALFLSLMVMLVPLYQSTLSLFEQRQISLTQKELQSGLAQLEQQIESLNGIAFSIGNDSEFRTFARKNLSQLSPAEYLRLHNLHEEFARLCLAQPYVEDYGLLMQNDLLMTRDRIHYPQDDYYGSFISFGTLDKEAFFQTFGHPSSLSLFTEEMTVVRDGTPYQAIVWLCSMSQTFTRNPSGVFFATFKQDTLKTLLMADLDKTQAGFTLSTSGGVPLMQFGMDAFDGQVHTLCAASGRLQVELVLSNTLFTSMMKPIRNLMFVFFGLLVLAGVILSVLLAVRSGRPVSKLEALARQVNALEEQPLNSFEYIGNTLASLASSVDEYKQALTTQQLLVRDHAFSAMLRETPIKESLISQQRLQEFRQCFPKFPARYQLAVVMIRDENISMENLAQRLMELLGLIESHFSPAPYVHTRGHQAVLVLDGEKPWLEQLAALRKSAREQFQLPLLIALSDEATCCEELHARYQQTKAILRLASQEGNKEILDVWQSGNFPDLPYELPLDYAEMAQLHTLLLHGETAGALSLLNAIGSRLCSASFLDDVINRQVFYNIRSVLLRVKLERIDVLSHLEIPDYHGELNNVLLLGRLIHCCEEMCALLEPLSNSRQAAFAASVCRFINEHLGDSTLGVGMVADYFAISPPTLQKAIKQETGSTFFDYVEQLRFDKAVLLLKHSNTPIAQIAEECGFNSINSFYKAFKRKSTLTPAVVRQQMREN